MAEKNENNKDSQKGQVTPKRYLKKLVLSLLMSCNPEIRKKKNVFV